MTAIWEEHLNIGVKEFSSEALKSARVYFAAMSPQFKDLGLVAYFAACYMKGFDAGRNYDDPPEELGNSQIGVAR